MKKILVISMLAMAICLSAALLVQAQDRKIVVIGDSLTFQTNFGPSVVNRGIPGATAHSILKRLPRILPEDADVVSLMIGINNLLNGESPEDTADNISELLGAITARVPGAKVYLVSVLPTTVSEKLNEKIVALNNLLGQIVDNVSQQFPDLAIESKVGFINIHDSFAEADGLTAKVEYIRPRNVHLTKGGQKYLRQLLEPYWLE